jgi:putative ABC transport system permease protein
LRPAQTLRAGRRRFGSRTLAGWLVGLQFAVASMLIIAVLTMHRQNEAMHQAFAVRSDPVVVLQPSLKVAGIDFDVLRGELTRSPSISTVSALRNPPWSMSTSTTRVARRVEALGEAPNVRTHSVAHDFFAAFGIQVLAGRVFEARLDDASLSENARLSPNIVVDRTFTAQLGFASPADALDTVVYAAPADPGVPPTPARIVGVVETRQMGLLGFWGASNIYVLNVPQSSYAVVRVKRDQLRDGLAAIDATWRELAPDIALRRSFADELFERGYRYFDGIRRVFTGIAIFALLIAVMGLVGMAVHIVGGRTHEVGVRKTLGASQSRVLAMLMSDFSKPVLIANLIAWPLAFLVEQGYVRVLVERASVSLAPYLLGLALTLAIAWLAVVGQAVHAAGVRPARVLRYE